MAGAGRAWSAIGPAGGGPRAAGAYSPVVRAGDFIYVSGQVPKDQSTGRIVDGDVADQTRAVFSNLSAALASAGATLSDVVSVTAYLSRIEDWDSFNSAYAELFEPPYPTRTTVGAGLHGFAVEISAVAYVPL